MNKIFYSLGLFLMVLVILKFGKLILAPIVLSAFIAILLSGSTQKLIKKGVNATIASASITILVFSLFALLIAILGVQYVDVLNKLPQWDEQITQDVNEIGDNLTLSLGLSSDFTGTTMSRIKTMISQNSGHWLGSLWKTIVSTSSILFLVPVFVFFMLLYQKKFHDTLELWLERRSKTKTQRLQIMNDAQQSVSNYIRGILLVILILGILNIIGLALIGVPYFILLGASAAMLSIIPYLGNILGGGFTMIISYASTGDPWIMLKVLILFAIIQAIEGNLITPFVMKDKVNINPFAIILALLIGGAIWGIIGMIISVPALAILKVYMQKDPDLKDYAMLLGEGKLQNSSSS